MKLGYYKNENHWKFGDSTGVGSFGVLSIIDGEAFINDTPLVDHIKNFADRKCTFEFVFPEKVEYEIDGGILNLVQALQRKGIRTMASCAGHISEQGSHGDTSRVPYVTFYDPCIPSLNIPDGWHSEQGRSFKLWKLVADVEVTDEATELVAKKLIETATEFYK